MTSRIRPPDVDPDAPPTEEELREAAAFGQRLAANAHDDELVALANGVSALRPRRPSAAEAAALEAAANRAVENAVRGGKVLAFPVRRVAAAISGAVALAASVLFVMQTRHDSASLTMRDVAPAIALVESRSSEPLFDSGFSQQTPTARIDRIAAARMDDLRENRLRLAMAHASRRSR